MSQRAIVPWLVEPGETNGGGSVNFTAACRGHEKLGRLLGYFTALASWEAQNQHLVEAASIEVTTTHKRILTKVSISQNTLTTYLRRLETWGFLDADSHRHRYQVHICAIQEAAACPPEPLPKKPRGRYAVKRPQKEESQMCESFNLGKEITNLGKGITNLGKEIANLGKEIANLRITNLTEGTVGAALEGLFDTLRIYSNSIESHLVASNEEGGTFQIKETGKETEEGSAPAPHRRPDGQAGSTSGEKPARPQSTTPAKPTSRRRTSNVSRLRPVKCDPDTVIAAINAVRGYALDQHWPKKAERTKVTAWCQDYTLKEFNLVIEHLTTGTCSNPKHKHWRKPGNLKAYLNANHLLTLTPEVLACTGHIPPPDAPEEVPALVQPPLPATTGWHPVMTVLPRR